MLADKRRVRTPRRWKLRRQWLRSPIIWPDQPDIINPKFPSDRTSSRYALHAEDQQLGSRPSSKYPGDLFPGRRILQFIAAEICLPAIEVLNCKPRAAGALNIFSFEICREIVFGVRLHPN